MFRSTCGVAVLGGFLALSGFAALPASAQEGGAAVEHVDRVARGGPPGAGFRAPEGVKLVSPGALLFASFDRNFDGRISREEIASGAAGAFAAADANKDGKLTGFEQNDWAAAVGGQGDVLSNAMTFDPDLDRSVTPAEFSGGLTRIADQMMGGGADIAFSELVKPLRRPDEQADARPGVVARPPASQQASPSVVGN